MPHSLLREAAFANRPSADRLPVASVVFLWCAIGVLPMVSDCHAAQTSAPDDGVTGQTEAEERFANRVLPVFRRKCLACHGDDPDELRGDFDMRSRAALLTGGESSEPALIPGDADNSPIVRAIRHDDLVMPPKESDRLTEAEIRDVTLWVAAGAPWPTDERIAELIRTSADRWNAADGVQVATSGGLSDDWTSRRYQPENLWAYQPLADVRIEGIDPTSPRGGSRMIDALLAEQLAVQPGASESSETRQLELAPLADRRTLIRRATFDLTGLPPTPGHVDEFLNDPASDDDAFAALVDRLLASPHYGERWGQHWLDVVRYADSSGYANDYERGSAWRYRDYVIRSFNADKPYDQFIREQIAGDEIDSGNPELLVAVGFLRMGPWELTGMEVARVARQRFLDDVTDAVGQVFLGHMLQCARCHDHKFDPVPTRDYYAMQSVFATTQFADRPAPFLPDENTNGFDEVRRLDQRQQFYEATLAEVNSRRTIAAARQWYADNNIDSGLFEEIVSQLRGKQSEEQIDLQQVRQMMAKRKADPGTIPPRHVGFEPRDFGLERIGRKGLERLNWRRDRYEPLAFSVYDGGTPDLRSVNSPLRLPDNPEQSGQVEDSHILIGGDPFSAGPDVEPGVLSVVAGMQSSASDESNDGADDGTATSGIPATVAGRRQALADWIASRDNPLTARVLVNRIWQWHFGRGLAGNPNNFGATGKKPTHPRLLHWLARRFIDSGWSIKSLHRDILLTQAWRRSAMHPDPESFAQHDPHGTSYAVFQPRRLSAEELRDAMLLVSGELNPAVGGIPVCPEMNLEAALQPRMVMGTFAEAWQPNPLPEQRHRRSLYALRLRGQRDPFLEVFNAPSPDLSCEAREASTVTPQVFALFNSPITFDRALALAQHVLRADGSAEETIQQLFLRTYGRPAEPAEIDACLQHWQRMTQRHRTLQFDPPQYPLEVVREAVEENTGEKFTFTEPLESYAGFVPDLKPSDASPEQRGLAEVCLVLLNSNEFLHVY